MSITPSPASTGYASRGAAPATVPVDTRPPVSTPPAGIQRMAELNADIAPAVGELPKQASAAPKDGVDRRAPAPGPTNDGGGVEAKPPGKATESGSKDDTKQLIAEVNKKTPVELMKMMREGNIPESIAENPAAMQAMVQRIQDFSRMVQMISQMMQAEHEMLMAIIRNIKA
jgi:hypothetical protein